MDLMKQNVCFWIGMSDEGVGEAYYHEGMRKTYLCIVVCAGILVVFSEMDDVNLMT